MSRGKFFAAVSAALLAPLSASAQTVPGVPVGDNASGSTCELHVWPATGLNSVYSGWFHGGIVNGAVTGRDGYPEVPADPVDTAAQVSLLSAAHPQDALQRGSDRLIVHSTALSSREIRSATTRLEASTAPCYAELIVDDVFLQQDIVDGAYLKTLFRYRQFGIGALPERVFGTWVKTRLALFPPKSPADLPASQQEFKTAFTNNIALFAVALRKPPKPKR